MNINDFYTDLASHIDGLLPSIWRVMAEKVDQSWVKTVIMNIMDIDRSPDSDVYKIECEIVMTDSNYENLATETKTVQDGIHGFRGLFPTVGGDTRAFVLQSIHGVKINEDRAEGITEDLPHLRFVANFFVESA